MFFRVKVVKVAGQVEYERDEAEPDLVLLVAGLHSPLLHPLHEGGEHDEVGAGERRPFREHLLWHVLLYQGAGHPGGQRIVFIETDRWIKDGQTYLTL